MLSPKVLNDAILATYVYLNILDKKKEHELNMKLLQAPDSNFNSYIIPGAVAGGSLGYVLGSPVLGTALGTTIGAGLDLASINNIIGNTNVPPIQWSLHGIFSFV